MPDIALSADSRLPRLQIPFESKDMTRYQIISEVQKAFGHFRRPDMFIRGTCSCEECMEHEGEMQTFNPDDLPLDQLNNPGWDPICFASNEAFGYFMPGLVKLVLDHTDDYVQQFIFHSEQPDRLAVLTPEQAQALSHVLDFLVLHESEALDNNLAVDDVYRAREKLEQIAGGDAKKPCPST